MPRLRLPKEEDFSSRLRGPAVASRVGLWLGICFVVAFVTGLYSHVSQEAVPWFTLPTRPSWAYQVSQGLHVISGTAAVPLLLVKLWSVFPKLFAPPPWTKPRTELVLNALERASIGVLVAAAIFQLVTGLANSAQWYPWSFGFRSTHYAVGWIAIGAILVHVAVKLPVIRRALGSDVDDDSDDGPDDAPAESPHDTPVEAADDTLAEATAGRAAAPEEVDETTGGLSRRGLLRTTWVAAALVVLGTAGSTVPFLRQVSVFGVRSGDGPAGSPSTGPQPPHRSPRQRSPTTTGSRSSTAIARCSSRARIWQAWCSTARCSRSPASKDGARPASGPESGSETSSPGSTPPTEPP